MPRRQRSWELKLKASRRWSLTFRRATSKLSNEKDKFVVSIDSDFYWKETAVHCKWSTLLTTARLTILSPGQTDRQVVTSGRKLNLRRDLRWVAKRLASFFASTRKSRKKDRLSSILLANNRLMDVTQFALTWVGWPNGEKLASACVQIWCRPKWVQVIASQVASWTKSLTCVKLRLRLARALLYYN